MRTDSLSVALVERGPDIHGRACPARKTGVCANCAPWSITCGWGGAGAFSAAAHAHERSAAGWTNSWRPNPPARAHRVRRRCAVSAAVRRTPPRCTAAARRPTDQPRGAAARHDAGGLAGAAHGHRALLYDILTRMREELEPRIDVFTGTRAERILTEKRSGEADISAAGVLLDDGRRLTAGAVVVAPGREGAGWLARRVPAPSRSSCAPTRSTSACASRWRQPSWSPSPRALYESKLVYYTPTFDDPVRTFYRMNPYGEVSLENYGDVITVNGHSYADLKTDRTNFALLVSTDFTGALRRLPHRLRQEHRTAWPISSARTSSCSAWATCSRATAPRANACNTGTIQPTLKGATPGDLSFVLPYRHLRDILEMLEAMDNLAPGVNGRDTLLYGVEVKFYSARPQLDEGLQTPVRGTSTPSATAPASRAAWCRRPRPVSSRRAASWRPARRL